MSGNVIFICVTITYSTDLLWPQTSARGCTTNSSAAASCLGLLETSGLSILLRWCATQGVPRETPPQELMSL